MGECTITIRDGNQWPTFIHSPHIGFDDWFRVIVKEVRFLEKGKNDWAVWEINPLYLDDLIGFAKDCYGNGFKLINLKENPKEPEVFQEFSGQLGLF
jgi:hypothetical protein